jgi:predicted hydrocarbon binding protein
MAHTISQETESYCSSQLGRLIFMGMDEVMGRAGVNAAMNRAGLPSLSDTYLDYQGDALLSLHQLGAALGTLQQLYGLKGGQGLALQTGRAAFNYGMRDFGEGLGLLHLDYRLLPPAVKVRVGLQRLATFMSGIGSGEIRIEETGGRFFWLIERCPLCWQRPGVGPVCHLWVGFLQEYLVWASGGKHYSVFETECVACGASACKIVIDQQALD